MIDKKMTDKIYYQLEYNLEYILGLNLLLHLHLHEIFIFKLYAYFKIICFLTLNALEV